MKFVAANTPAATSTTRRILFASPPTRIISAAAINSTWDASAILAMGLADRARSPGPPPSPELGSLIKDIDCIIQAQQDEENITSNSSGATRRHHGSSVADASPMKRAMLSSTPVPYAGSEEAEHPAEASMEMEATVLFNDKHDDAMMMDEDTLFALQIMRQEEEEFLQRIHEEQERALRELRRGGDGANLDAITAAAASGEDDVEHMTYDDLLDLGQQMGDVRRERWRERSAQVVARLRMMRVSEWHADASLIRTYKDEMCLVCHCEFSSEEMIRLMPACSHCFHVECIDVWLRDNDTCVTCKTGVE
jgi:hypothetical protein